MELNLERNLDGSTTSELLNMCDSVNIKATVLSNLSLDSEVLDGHNSTREVNEIIVSRCDSSSSNEGQKLVSKFYGKPESFKVAQDKNCSVSPVSSDIFVSGHTNEIITSVSGENCHGQAVENIVSKSGGSNSAFDYRCTSEKISICADNTCTIKTCETVNTSKTALASKSDICATNIATTEYIDDLKVHCDENPNDIKAVAETTKLDTDKVNKDELPNKVVTQITYNPGFQKCRVEGGLNSTGFEEKDISTEIKSKSVQKPETLEKDKEKSRSVSGIPTLTDRRPQSSKDKQRVTSAKAASIVTATQASKSNVQSSEMVDRIRMQRGNSLQNDIAASVKKRQIQISSSVQVKSNQNSEDNMIKHSADTTCKFSDTPGRVKEDDVDEETTEVNKQVAATDSTSRRPGVRPPPIPVKIAKSHQQQGDESQADITRMDSVESDATSQCNSVDSDAVISSSCELNKTSSISSVNRSVENNCSHSATDDVSLSSESSIHSFTASSAHVDLWDHRQVVMWLEKQNLSAYAGKFLSNNITGQDLLSMNSARMKTIGMSSSKDRDHLKKKIKDLKTSVEKDRKLEERANKQRDNSLPPTSTNTGLKKYKIFGK